jgi:hypothetical protein
VMYHYSNPDRGQVARWFDVGEIPPASVWLDDDTEMFLNGQDPVERHSVQTWPRECFISGVHSSQAQELRDFFASKGEKVEVTPDGNPVYTSRKHRKRLLALRGMVDRGAYG